MDEIIARGTGVIPAGITEWDFLIPTSNRPLVIRIVQAHGATINSKSYCVVPALIEEAPVLAKESHPKTETSRGRGEWNITIFGGITYGVTDDGDVYFDPAVTDLKIASASGKLALEGVFPSGLGLRLQGGYQHNFYTNIGLSQIKKSYALAEFFAEYFFLKNISHWDPYLFAGTSILFSSSGYQPRLAGGMGVRYFFSDAISLRLEPVVLTDFEGIQGEVNLGIGFHF